MWKNRSKEYSPLVRYGAAFLLTAIAVAIVLIVRPRLELKEFNLFQGAVFLSAWVGGLGPGLTACVLSIVAIFGVSTFIISLLSARARLEQAKEELDQRLQERTEQLSRANMQLSSEIANRLEAEKAILEISQREQERMGQDLHDGLCQTLAGVRLIAETLNDELTEGSFPQKAYVDKIEGLLSQALTQADSVSRGLYPVELESGGLMTALQELAGNVSRVYSVRCTFVCRRKILVQNMAIANHLFRITQEAVTNAIKAGKAQKINIRFLQLRSYILLAVADDGIGFDPTHTRKGMGLNIIQYRARIINATFQLRRRRKGTLAVCTFSAPVAERETAHDHEA